MVNESKKPVLTKILESCANEIIVPPEILARLMKRLDERKDGQYNG